MPLPLPLDETLLNLKIFMEQPTIKCFLFVIKYSASYRELILWVVYHKRTHSRIKMFYISDLKFLKILTQSLVGWAANGNPTELLYFRWVSLG
jgi:hypothetical protein